MDSTFKVDKIKFIYTMLLYALFTWKSNYYYSFTDVFVAVAINTEVSFNTECHQNFLSLQYHLLHLEHNKKKQAIRKILTFDLQGYYLNMWVTFDVSTCNRMIKLKMASKRSELDCNKIWWLIWKLEHWVITLWLAILVIIVC